MATLLFYINASFCDNVSLLDEIFRSFRSLRLIELAIVAGLLVGAVSASGVLAEDQALKVGSEVTIKGEVLGREKRREGLADGESALRVSTPDYGVVNVVYSSFRLCRNEVGAAAQEGDRLEVFGKVTNKDRVTVCTSKTYYIKKL